MRTKLYEFADALARVRAHMPIAVTVRDPFTAQEMTVVKEDMIALLVVDGAELGLQSQIVAAQYAEFARLQRSAEYAHELADRAFTSWKAARSAEYRKARTPVDDDEEEAPPTTGKKKAAKKPAGRAPTVAEVEDHYRSLPEYLTVAGEVSRWKMLSGLFEDLKDAVRIKSQMLSSQLRTYEYLERTARTERD